MKIRFFSNEVGTTAIEFALLMPVLCVIIMCSIELSMYLFVQTSLEGATFAASRLGKTGYIADEQTREETIKAAISDRVGFFLNMDQMQIDSKEYNNFTSVGSPEPYIDANHNGQHDVGENYTDSNGNGHYDEDMGVAGLGDSGEVVVYTVSYPWHILTPFLSKSMGEDGVVNITSRFIVKNEPYSDD